MLEEEIEIEATVSTIGKTGVEMESLTAVMTTALTIYDMCKCVDKDIYCPNLIVYFMKFI